MMSASLLLNFSYFYSFYYVVKLLIEPADSDIIDCSSLRELLSELSSEEEKSSKSKLSSKLLSSPSF